MKNIKLIYNHINEKASNKGNGNIEIKITDKFVTSKTLLYIAQRVKYLMKYKYLKYNIIFTFSVRNFADKITYLILDAIIYDIFLRTNFKVFIKFLDAGTSNVHTEGFQSTAMERTIENKMILYREGFELEKKTFMKLYEKNYIDEYTYRRILSKEDLEDIYIESIVSSEVSSILNTSGLGEEWKDSISEVISELICNVRSHTENGCLIDINIVKDSDVCISRDKEQKDVINELHNCSIINIAAINFSESRLFDKVKHNIKDKKYMESDKLYNQIYKVYDNHKMFLIINTEKTISFLITSFQNHVTSRYYESGNSGTGLTSLIKNIIGKTDSTYSYILSGNNILYFMNEYLESSEDGFVGFNSNRDYINERPSDGVIQKSALYIPGTIYNLLLLKED